MKPRKTFEVRHIQVDITTEDGKGYFLIGDEVDIDVHLPCMKIGGVVKYFKQKENFQRIYIHLDEPIDILHVGNKFKKSNGKIRKTV
jgi:hypothetical protein